VAVVASTLALAVLCGTRAESAKPTDEGKAAVFKGKTFELKEKGEASIILIVPAGEEGFHHGEERQEVGRQSVHLRC
jgi:hypothetical protein